ncbi:MAG: hypothetical protein PHQ41_03240 [Candidatus Cloacimonetes bacterium]|nr:hypothetical protein [Candidatus Cloacimonadota bacterium]
MSKITIDRLIQNFIIAESNLVHGGIMLNEVVQKVIALGIPGLVLVVVIGTTGLAGGAAIVAALAVLGGPFGMLGGIAALAIMTLVADAVTQYGLDQIAIAVVDGLMKNGHNKDDIWNTINGIPRLLLSKRIKEKCRSYIYR